MPHALPPDTTLGFALSAAERAEAVRYIECRMREHFGGDPPPTRGLICVARTNGTIVGTMVLQGSPPGEPFPIEDHYDFDGTHPFHDGRDSVIEGSRWIASVPGISRALVIATMTLARDLGKRRMLIEAKPYSTKRLAELGFICRPIGGASLSIARVRSIVGDSGMPYYLTPPAPCPYLIDLGDAIA